MGASLNLKPDEIVLIPSSQDLTNKTYAVKSEQRKYWDREYVNGCIDRTPNATHQMLLRFLWMSGVRISEAVALTKGDIDFSNNTFTVKWLKNRKYLHRVVPMHRQLKAVLQLYTGPMLAADRVFPMTRQRAWQITQKTLGGHPHQLRHSFAVNWLRCGGDLVTLHRVLGHSKIQTTMEYLKIVPVDQAKELERISF